MKKYSWIWNGKKCTALLDGQGRVIHGTYWSFNMDVHSNAWPEWLAALRAHVQLQSEKEQAE